MSHTILTFHEARSWHMPYWVHDIYDHTRMAAKESYFELLDSLWRPLWVGAPLTPEVLARIPDPLYFRPPECGDVPHIVGAGGGPNGWIMSEKARRLVVSLEPHVHTFIPVNLQVRGSDKDFGEYSLLYVGQAIDAIVRDQTQFQGGFGLEGYKKKPSLSPLRPNIVMDGQLITGKHLWRGGIGKIEGGGDPFWWELFCSDELAELFKANSIDGWSFDRPCRLAR